METSGPFAVATSKKIKCGWFTALLKWSTLMSAVTLSLTSGRSNTDDPAASPQKFGENAMS